MARSVPAPDHQGNLRVTRVPRSFPLPDGEHSPGIQEMFTPRRVPWVGYSRTTGSSLAMDGNQFDTVLRSIAASRRTALGGVAATLAGIAGWSDIQARKKKKKCKSPKVKCGKKCLPAGFCCDNSDCGICRTCNGNTCVLAPAGSACGVGGSCNGTACIQEGSFGCNAARDFCSGEVVTVCPNSNTPDAMCFMRDEVALCGTGDCFIAATDQECREQLGPRAIRIPCATCTLLSPPPGWAACVIPVTA